MVSWLFCFLCVCLSLTVQIQKKQSELHWISFLFQLNITNIIKD